MPDFNTPDVCLHVHFAPGAANVASAVYHVPTRFLHNVRAALDRLTESGQVIAWSQTSTQN